MTRPAILITGCSTGLGRATAELLLTKGCTVVATARRVETLAKLESVAAAGGGQVVCLPLDVTQPQSVDKALQAVTDQGLHVDVLVNNAGYGHYGPLEEVSAQQLKDQFDTNIFGLMDVTQKVLPGMRHRRQGRIVNISSLVGIVSFPYLGVYCASKFALEALTNALRGELKNWNIKVISVNPGPVKSNFAARSRGDGIDQLAPNSPYRPMYANVLGRAGQGHETEKKKKMTSEQAAQIIVRACLKRKPSNRYKITAFAKIMPFLQWLLPEDLFQKILWRQMKI